MLWLHIFYFGGEEFSVKAFRWWRRWGGTLINLTSKLSLAFKLWKYCWRINIQHIRINNYYSCWRTRVTRYMTKKYEYLSYLCGGCGLLESFSNHADMVRVSVCVSKALLLDFICSFRSLENWAKYKTMQKHTYLDKANSIDLNARASILKDNAYSVLSVQHRLRKLNELY